MSQRYEGLKVQGLRELKKELRAGGHDLKQLKEPNRAAVNIVLARAAELAPVGKTRRLVKSLKVSATMRAGTVKAGSKRVPYAAPVHWGWPDRNIPANEFMTRAAAETEPQWQEEYAYHLNNIIRQIHNGVNHGT